MSHHPFENLGHHIDKALHDAKKGIEGAFDTVKDGCETAAHKTDKAFHKAFHEAKEDSINAFDTASGAIIDVCDKAVQRHKHEQEKFIKKHGG